MYDKYAEHLRDSASDNSRWDGYDRGDCSEPRHGHRVIGRMTSGGGYRVEIVEYWHEQFGSFFEVYVDRRRVHATDDRTAAVTVARWWMDGCPV